MSRKGRQRKLGSFGHGLRRLLAWGGLGLFMAGTAAAGWWLSQPGHLPVRSIQLVGELQHVRAEEIREVVLPHAQAGFVAMDLAAVQASLEQLPWVHSAQVHRAWPDVLQVQLHEQQVLARWGEQALVNPEGKVFQSMERVAASLPVLRGPEGTSLMVTAQFLELQKMLWQQELIIEELVMDERRSWMLRLDNGLELLLGRSEHPVRVERFMRAWPHILAPRRDGLVLIDLRYANGFAVTSRES